MSHFTFEKKINSSNMLMNFKLLSWTRYYSLREKDICVYF